MADQCKHCIVRGDIDKCKATECSHHKNWYAIKQQEKINALQDFVIWMTGCGYDFCQHEYFCQQRDALLKDYCASDSDNVE